MALLLGLTRVWCMQPAVCRLTCQTVGAARRGPFVQYALSQLAGGHAVAVLGVRIHVLLTAMMWFWRCDWQALQRWAPDMAAASCTHVAHVTRVWLLMTAASPDE